MVKVQVRINKNFRDYLKARKISISELASVLNYTKQQVSQCVSGKVEPTRPFLRRLAAHTLMGVEDLVVTTFKK